jgi:hypothetical protein
LQWFENESQLSGSDRDKFNFQKGTVSLIRKIKKKQPLILIRCKLKSTARKVSIIWALWLMREMIIRKQQNIFDAVW